MRTWRMLERRHLSRRGVTAPRWQHNDTQVGRRELRRQKQWYFISFALNCTLTKNETIHKTEISLTLWSFQCSLQRTTEYKQSTVNNEQIL